MEIIDYHRSRFVIFLEERCAAIVQIANAACISYRRADILRKISSDVDIYLRSFLAVLHRYLCFLPLPRPSFSWAPSSHKLRVQNVEMSRNLVYGPYHQMTFYDHYMLQASCSDIQGPGKYFAHRDSVMFQTYH